jgi:hypothetical protein
MTVLTHLSLLGHRVRDRVTGIEGVVTHVGFDLYGCIQCIVHPGIDQEKKTLLDTIWFDVARLENLSSEPVMSPPDFFAVASPSLAAAGRKGPSEKPCDSKP